MAKILLVDDEKDIVEFLQYNLETEGFDVISAFDGEMALEKVKEKPDLIVLDVMMPKMNGYDVCKNIRLNEEYDEIPIIFLTAKTSEFDELKGFDLGGDDYIKKPISPKMLVARVKSKIKRIEKTEEKAIQNSSLISIGPLEINKDKFEVKVNGNNIILPKKEFAILYYLAKKPGKVFPRDRILNDVWGEDIYVIERTVDVHIRKIREKLGEEANLIETIKGVGYRFREF
ncbi:MAG: response regulator transcription factor [Ignavibacteriales bacterium]|nr:response regulator transcription factor [Ignavibacteriales bacterium]MCB9217904.1 response regulator transcription factor [Ignavibacteriales bacterium]